MRVKIIYYSGKYDILDSENIYDDIVVNHIKKSNEDVRKIVALEDFKICNKCQKEVYKKYIPNEFYPHINGVDGYKKICKECYNSERRKNNES